MDGMKKLTYTQTSVSNCCFVKFWGERGSTSTGLKDKIRFRDEALWCMSFNNFQVFHYY